MNYMTCRKFTFWSGGDEEHPKQRDHFSEHVKRKNENLYISAEGTYMLSTIHQHATRNRQQ
jgi:hypothetical protein